MTLSSFYIEVKTRKKNVRYSVHISEENRKKLSFGYTEVMYAKDIFSLSNFRTPTKNSRT